MNNEIFEQNLKFLELTRPEVGKRIRELEPDPSWELREIKEDIYNLFHDGKPFYPDNFYEEGEKTVKAIKFRFPKIIVIYGIGLGYHIRDFFKLNTKICDHILIVEKSHEVFRQALHAFDWSPILKDYRVNFLIGVEEEEEICDFFEDYMQVQARMMLVQALSSFVGPCHSTEEQTHYLRTALALKNTCEKIGENLSCPPEDAYRGYMNIVRNLPRCHGIKSVQELKDCFKGRPGIIVSTGPSLKYSLPWLKEVGDRAVIACADSALKILLQHGITPHFVGTLERVPQSSQFFKDLPPLPNTFLVTNPVVWPDTYKWYTGPMLHMMRPIGQLHWLFPEQKTYHTGRSVAHMMFHTLVEMGCSPIILTGQDLAYERDTGKSHADGASEYVQAYGKRDHDAAVKLVESGKISKKEKNEMILEGNNGEPIISSYTYRGFRDEFNTFIRREKTTCYNVIPKEYGAKIRQAIWMDPSDAPSLLSGDSFPVIKTVKQTLTKLPTESFKEYRKRMGEKIEIALAKLEMYRSLSLDVVDAISLHTFEYDLNDYAEDKKIYPPFMKKLEEMGNNFFKCTDEFYFWFLHALTQNRLVTNIQKFQGYLHEDLPKPERLNKQINSVIDTFMNGSMIWAARLHRFLERNKDQIFIDAKVSPEKERAYAGLDEDTGAGMFS